MGPVALMMLNIAIAAGVQIDRSVVVTTTGPIKGTLMNDFGVEYYKYEGIPYAEKPIGDLRFKPPVPKKPWVDVLNATGPRYACPQVEVSYIGIARDQMSEDCLYMNVFVPANAGDQPLPVLAYIHSGEFRQLTSYPEIVLGPEFLLKQNVIFVTFNYRLGALGFLSLETDEASGNMGLKDCILALKWINANAARFGGDRNKITLGGNSSGAAAVHFLLLSTKSTGLYSQAVMISGSALSYRFLAKYPYENAKELGKLLNITASSKGELLKQLKAADVFDIIDAQDKMGSNDTRKAFRPYTPFVPCVEEYSDAVITQNPRDIVKEGIPNKVPILLGFNKDEGLKQFPTIKKNRTLLDYLNEDFERCIPTDIEYPYGSQESKDLAASIRQFYVNGGNITNATINGFFDLVTDTMFTHSITDFIDLYKIREDSNKMYFYELAYDGKLNWGKITGEYDYPGTAHGDELGYLFVTKATKSILRNLDSTTQRMVDFYTTVLMNFVKFGDPTPQNGDVGVTWDELKQGTDYNRSYLYIDVQPELKQGYPIVNRLEFWKNAYGQYYSYLENGGRIEPKVI